MGEISIKVEVHVLFLFSPIIVPYTESNDLLLQQKMMSATVNLFLPWRFRGEAIPSA